MSAAKVGWACCLICLAFNLSLDAWVQFPTFFSMFEASFEFCKRGELYLKEGSVVEFITGLTQGAESVMQRSQPRDQIALEN
jgi:hypothetical protein